MLKRILKWIGITSAVIVTLLCIITPFRQNLKYDAPYPKITASTDSAVINRGRHLVMGPTHCVQCHSNGNSDSLLDLDQDVPLTGGYKFQLPVGDIYSKNITPDNETGIGKYTDEQVARILRYGVHVDGRAVYDFMPFHNASDEDITAIISYLRSQKPVREEEPKNRLNLIGNLVQAYMIKPVGPEGIIPKSVQVDSTVEYGQYLATRLADCGGCHTERSLSGEFTGKQFAGGNELETPAGSFNPPNITNDPTGKTYGWSQELFIKRFRQGRVIPNSPMPWNSYKRMTDTEIKAIYKYLKSVPAVASKNKPSFVPNK